MPRKPKKPCRWPGCPNLTDDLYCEEHTAQARRQYDRFERAPDVHKKYGRAWSRFRNGSGLNVVYGEDFVRKVGGCNAK